MTPRPESSRGLLRLFARPGLTIMGDPEDDEEEEEEEEKKGEEDEEEEGNEGEEDEVPWEVTVPDGGMRATMRCSVPYFPLPPTLYAAGKIGTHTISKKMCASPFFRDVVYWFRHAASA